MIKWIIIGIAIIICAGLAYGWYSQWHSRGQIIDQQEKISDVLATGLSETDEKLIEAWKEIQDNRKEIERLKKSRGELEEEKAHIVVPDNLADLVAAFNKHGLRASAGRA